MEKQHYVRAPKGDELDRIQADCRRMGYDLMGDQIRRVLYAASRVYGDCDQTGIRRRMQADADALLAKRREAAPAV
jgi:hypothetical protein